MTSGRMDDDMPDSIRRNEHTKKCRHTMPEKWTEIDGEKDGEGEEMGIAGIPARTGHTQETGNKNSPTLRENGGLRLSQRCDKNDWRLLICDLLLGKLNNYTTCEDSALEFGFSKSSFFFALYLFKGHINKRLRSLQVGFFYQFSISGLF